jgi:RNA polymerase sigma-70 factor (ECF subfamily)
MLASSISLQIATLDSEPIMEETTASPSLFPTTQWSVVLEAAANQFEGVAPALERLCARYWLPIYAFVRRRGHDAHVAEDLTQGFFAFLLEHRAFERVDRDKGRFRSFILASLTHFLLDEYDRNTALKRGGGRRLISLDELVAGETLVLGATDHATPEQYFERNWAATLVRRVLQQLRVEYHQRGQGALFAGLQPALTGDLGPGAHERLAQHLQMNPGAVRVALHRARRRFGQLLRHEVAHTVSRPEDVEEELRHLLAAIAE